MVAYQQGEPMAFPPTRDVSTRRLDPVEPCGAAATGKGDILQIARLDPQLRPAILLAEMEMPERT